MFRTILAAIFLLVASPVLAADWEGVFEGTLGKARILVQLDAGQDKSAYKGCCSDGSRYSYLPKPYDLKLVLQSEGKTLEFIEAGVPHYTIAELSEDDPKITGHWSVVVEGDEAKGTWTSRDKKKSLPIVLKRLPLLEGFDNPLVSTYNERWFRELKISGNAKAVSFKNVTLAFEQDSAFHLPMPVFTKFPDKGEMAKANAVLRAYYKQSLLNNRDCINSLDSEASVPKKPEYDFTVRYASPRVVTLMEGGSVFCGGAHPNNYMTFLTFDLLAHEQMAGREQLDLKPVGFGRVLKLADKQQRITFENFALGRWQKAAAAAGEAGEDGCAGANFLGEQQPGEKEFNLSFAAKGIAVQRYDYPSVAANCLFQDYNPTIIPWADIKPWLRPGQKLLTDEVK